MRNDGSIADYVSAVSPVAILENDGVLVTGSSVLDTFDRLEVLESTAEGPRLRSDRGNEPVVEEQVVRAAAVALFG